jgi:hypothetical protein
VENTAIKLEEGIALLQKAAAKNYGPAMYEIGYKQCAARIFARGRQGT